MPMSQQYFIVPKVNQEMPRAEANFNRRTRGSVTHASCNVVALESTNTFIEKQRPWYFAGLVHSSASEHEKATEGQSEKPAS
jgi:hypothetical protein